MIHTITYEDGSYNEWFEPGRLQCRPCPETEPDFFERTEATAIAISEKCSGWGGLRFYSSQAL